MALVGAAGLPGPAEIQHTQAIRRDAGEGRALYTSNSQSHCKHWGKRQASNRLQALKGFISLLL